MGQVHSVDKFFLKFRVYGSFHVAHPMRPFLRFYPFMTIEQGDTRAVSGGIANRIDVFQVAIGNKSQNHRVFWVNIAAKSARQYHAVYRLNVSPVHQ